MRTWHAALDPGHKTANSHAYALLHAICADAVGDHLLSENPCTIAKAMNAPRQRQPVILTVSYARRRCAWRAAAALRY